MDLSPLVLGKSRCAEKLVSACEKDAGHLGTLKKNEAEKKKKKTTEFWSSHRGSVKVNLTSIHENVGSIPGLV